MIRTLIKKIKSKINKNVSTKIRARARFQSTKVIRSNAKSEKYIFNTGSMIILE